MLEIDKAHIRIFLKFLSFKLMVMSKEKNSELMMKNKTCKLGKSKDVIDD